MKLNVAICDDEQSACSHIRNLLENYEMKYNFEFHISEFTDACEFISFYQKAGIFDIIFLDVEMPEMSGLSVAHTIRDLPDSDVKIIFTSNYPEYMQDSFNVSAFQYLQKPIKEEQLHEQFKRLLQEIDRLSPLSILVKHDDTEEPVTTSQILYIATVKSKKDLLRYVCKNRTLFGKGLLSDIESALLPHHFFSPHRGILINMRQVHFIKRGEIEMMNGDIIPLSRRREKEFRDYFNKELLQ